MAGSKINPDKLSLGFKDGFMGTLSIRSQLYILIFMFSFLLIGMILSTGISVWDHAGEDVEIEVVNHQRILLRTTTVLFSQGSQQEIDLAAIIQTIEQNQSALKDGGDAVTDEGVIREVPALHQGLSQDELDEFIKVWPSYRARLEAMGILPDGDPGRSMQEEKAREEYFILAGHLDSIFIGLERHMARDHWLLFAVQLAGLFLALPLVLWGSNIVRYRIGIPLEGLRQAAIRFGHGDSPSPLNLITKDEIADLARSFEEMQSLILKNKQNLEDQVSKRTQELLVAFEFSQEIIGHLEFEALIQNITDSASRLMKSEKVSLCLVQEDGRTVEMYADHRRLVTGRRRVQSVDLVSEVINEGRVVEAPLDELACKFLQSNKPARCLATPLRIGGRIMGALCVLQDSGRSYDETEKRALSLMANTAAIAIENARLVAAGKKQEQEHAMLAERQRLASELHDHLAQTLNLANLKVGEAQKLDSGYQNSTARNAINEAKRNMEIAISHVRMLMGEMIVPEEKNDSGEFVSQIYSRTEKFEEMTGISVEMKGLAAPFDRLSSLAQNQLLLILGEALTNIRRHAEAGQVVIAFGSDLDNLYTAIEDDGKGFDTEAPMESVHLGTRIMRMRAERVGGKIHTASSIGMGTRIELSLPFSPQEE